MYKKNIITRGLLIILISYLVIKQISSFNILLVRSGSMEPTIKTKSLIVIKSQNSYKKGDIVTYKTIKGLRNTTHRIVDTREIEKKKHYIVKGDNNREIDPFIITDMEILGKVKWVIPVTGFILAPDLKDVRLWIIFYLATGLILGNRIKSLYIHR